MFGTTIHFGVAAYALMFAIAIAAAMVVWQVAGGTTAAASFIPMLAGAYASSLALADMVNLTAVPGDTDAIALASMIGVGVVALLCLGARRMLER